MRDGYGYMKNGGSWGPWGYTAILSRDLGSSVQFRKLAKAIRVYVGVSQFSFEVGPLVPRHTWALNASGPQFAPSALILWPIVYGPSHALLPNTIRKTSSFLRFSGLRVVQDVQQAQDLRHIYSLVSG